MPSRLIATIACLHFAALLSWPALGAHCLVHVEKTRAGSLGVSVMHEGKDAHGAPTGHIVSVPPTWSVEVAASGT
jgi:hypothetical protein